jgi:methionyl-tRNA formyltransferase
VGKGRNMRIVFFGTPDYVVPVVDGLLKYFRTNSDPHPISAVITQSPKPAGREKSLTYSPVDFWAYEKKIPKYFEPTDLITEQISVDIGVLASYGQFIPEPVIKLFKYGILNIHPSLLPCWRGASPIQASIISGESKTGVSIIKLDKLLDHGLIVTQFIDEITNSETADTLRQRLFARSAEVIPTLIEAYITGKISLKKQDEEKETITHQIKREDAYIDPKAINSALKGKSMRKKWKINFIKDYSIQYSPSTICRFIRAMNPWPIAWSYIKIKKQTLRIKILQAHTDNSQLIPDEVQLEGKSSVSWKQFCQGYPDVKFADT